MIKNDIWITKQAKEGMISPFHPSSIREIKLQNQDNHRRVISYGCSSYGYDLRLDPSEFKVFQSKPGIVDPKNFEPEFVKDCELHSTEEGDFFILPPHTYGLGVVSEYLDIPRNISVICMGKSTYARTGIIINVTPIESCLSKDTEVLTKKGWKLIKNLIIGEEILSLDPINQKSGYFPITEKQEYFVNTYLNEIKSPSFSQLVTDNHKLWVGQKEENTNNYTYKLIKCKTILKEYANKKINSEFIYDEPRSLWGGNDKDLVEYLNDFHFFDPYTNKDKDNNYQEKGINYFLQLLGIISGYCNKYDYNFIDNFPNNSYITSIFINCLDELEIEYCIKEGKVWILNNKVLKKIKYLLQTPQSAIPISLIRNSPPKRIRQFIFGYIIAELNQKEINISTIQIKSINEILKSTLQELMFKIGFKSPIIDSEKITIYLTKPTPEPINITKINKIPYVGMVYDVTIPPHHIFLCRKDNLISWTGNSWRGYLTVEMSNSSASSCRIYANEGIAQIIFLEGNPCAVSYSDRKGKYLDQDKEVTLPRI